MAHFAQLDSDNKVVRVIVVGNKDCLDSDGIERESIGIAFCKSILGANARWVQTSYNNTIRGKYALPGDIYNPETDEFFTPNGPEPS